MSKKEEVQQGEMKMVPFSQITPKEDENARQKLTEIDQLAANIAEHGLLEPLGVVNGGPEETPYKVRYGSRRYAALAKLKWGDRLVPVIIHKQEDSILKNVIENVWRQDLPACDLAQRLHDLESGDAPGSDGKKYTKAELAKLIGKSTTHVSNLIRSIKNLSAKARKVWRDKDVPTTVIFSWAGMEPEEQSAAVEAYLEEQKRIQARLTNLAETGDPDDDGEPPPRRRKKKEEDDHKPLVKGKVLTAMETNKAIIEWKLETGQIKAKEEVAAAHAEINLIRHLIGDMVRYPSISAAERKEYAKWLEAQNAAAEGDEEGEE